MSEILPTASGIGSPPTKARRNIIDHQHHKKRDGVVASFPSSNYGNSLVESDEEDVDVDDLIASLEKSEKVLHIQPIPDDVVHFINKLCDDESVKDAILTRSPTCSNAICIQGSGVERIRGQLKAHYRNWDFHMKESGPLHTTQLCGGAKEIEEQRTGINEPNDRCWKPVVHLPFQLMVLGTETNKPSLTRALYAVIPAHKIISEPRCEEIITSNNSELIKEVRRETNAQAGEIQHFGDIAGLGKYHVKLPLMFAARHYFNNVNNSTDDPYWRCCAGECHTSDNCPHMHMNDIAVLRLEETPGNWPPSETCRSIRFDALIKLSEKQVSNIIENQQLVYFNEVNDAGDVQEFKGQLVRSFQTAGENANRTLALHVTFFIRRDIRAHKFPIIGGTILYLKDIRGPEVKRHAFAMIISGIECFDGWHYQAIQLRQALRDVELDYCHLVSNIKNAKRAPCRYLTANQ